MAGNAQCCLFLAQQGASLEAVDVKGRTALHLAAYKGETLAGLALLRMGARLDIKDAPYDRTPVAAALSAGYREAAKAFEEEATRSRPNSAATSLGMSTRPPSVRAPLRTPQLMVTRFAASLRSDTVRTPQALTSD